MAALDYATVAQVRAYLGVPSSLNIGPDDTDLGVFITNASRTIDAYAGQQFADTEDRTEWFDVEYGLQHLTLAHRPVVTLTSVQEADGEGILTDLDIGRRRGIDHCYMEDYDAGIIMFHFPFTETLKQRVKVTYTSGYTSATLPAEVQQATILLAARAAIRATLIDENCNDRIKEMWGPLLKATEAEYQEMLALVRERKLASVAVFGAHRPSGATWRLF